MVALLTHYGMLLTESGAQVKAAGMGWLDIVDFLLRAGADFYNLAPLNPLDYRTEELGSLLHVADTAG